MNARILTMVGIALLASAAFAEVYKWADEQGRIHYSDSPPDDTRPEQVEIEPGPAAADRERAQRRLNKLIERQKADREQTTADGLDSPLYHQCFANPNRACLIERALEAVKQIQVQRKLPCDSVELIATALAKAGDTDLAQETLVQAFALIPERQRPDGRAHALGTVATALANTGKVEEALAMAKDIRVAEFRIRVLQGIADVLRKSENDTLAQYPLRQALTMARQIDRDDRRRETILVEIAIALAMAGNVTQAVAAINDIEGPMRGYAFAGLASALATAGNVEKAQSTLNQALTEAREIGVDDRRRDLVFAAIATAQATAGDVGQALETANEIDNDYSRAQASEKIASALVRYGNVKEALAAAKEIDNDGFRNQALAGIAIELSEAENVEQALATMRNIDNPMWRGHALAGIARALAEAGNVGRALETAKEIDAANCRGSALGGIAATLAKTGNATQALATAKDIEDAELRARALMQIANTLAKGGHIKQARHSLIQVLAMAKEIDVGVHNREPALGEIATALAEAGNVAKALATAKGIEDADSRHWALLRIAVAQAKAGNRKGAVTTSNYIHLPCRRALAWVEIAVVLPK